MSEKYLSIAMFLVAVDRILPIVATVTCRIVNVFFQGYL